MLFDETKNIVTPSDGIAKLSFDPSKHTYGFNMGGNTKVGAIPTFSTLLGDYTYKKLTGKLKNIKGTCQNCGSCKKACYVRASYRFPSVIYSQAVNTWGMRNELDKVERDLAAQIKRYDICPAYVIPEGSKRAVRRPIHCDTCRLCIDKPTAKVIGCHDH